jgi:hypothetical protein
MQRRKNKRYSTYGGSDIKFGKAERFKSVAK